MFHSPVTDGMDVFNYLKRLVTNRNAWEKILDVVESVKFAIYLEFVLDERKFFKIFLEYL